MSLQYGHRVNLMAFATTGSPLLLVMLTAFYIHYPQRDTVPHLCLQQNHSHRDTPICLPVFAGSNIATLIHPEKAHSHSPSLSIVYFEEPTHKLRIDHLIPMRYFVLLYLQEGKHPKMLQLLGLLK